MLIQTLVDSARGGTITLAPDGTTTVTFDSVAPAQPLTRWQQTSGKGGGQWMDNKRRRLDIW